MVNRDEKCTNSSGGVSNLYVFKYVKYPRSNIKVVNNILEVFPFSVIYELESSSVNFTESVDTEDGGVVFNQSGSFQFSKITESDNFKEFLEQDWFVIIKDNNDKLRLIGLENGVKIKYTKETGTNLNEFNGFKFSFESKEENTAPFITDLSGFDINGLISLQQELQYTL